VAGSSYIEVSFPIPLNRTFHYRAEGGSIGSRVLAPFGPKKNLVGFVVGRTSEKPSFPTKEILLHIVQCQTECPQLEVALDKLFGIVPEYLKQAA